MAENLQVTGIKLDTGDLRRGSSRAEREFRKLESRANRLEREVDSTSSSFKRLGKQVAAVATAFGAFTAIRTAGKFIFETNKEFEQLEARLISITGSVSAAEQAFNTIVDFASETPFQIQSLTEAFTKLSAVGLQPTADMLRDLGNFAAAFGADIVDFTNAVIRAGTGMTRPLKKFGIIARSEGDKLKVTFRGVTRTVEKDFASVMQLFREMSQEQFAGGMARQMDTLNGIISNLKDNASILAKEIGEAGLNAEIKALVATLRDAIANGDEFAQNMGQFLAGGVRMATEALAAFIEHSDTIIRGLKVLATVAIGRAALPALRSFSFAIRAAAGGAVFMTDVVVGLRAALTALGGPTGILVGAAALFFTFSERLDVTTEETRKLKDEIDELTGSLKQMTAAQIESEMQDVRSTLRDTVEEMADLDQQIEDARGRMNERVGGRLGLGDPQAAADLSGLKGQKADLQERVTALQEALAEMSDELVRTRNEQAQNTEETREQSDATQELIEKLTQERDKLKFSETELIKRSDAFKDATAAQKEQILAILEEIDALEAEEEAQEKARKAAKKRMEEFERHAEQVRDANKQIKEQARRATRDFASNLQLAQIQEELRRIEDFSDRVGQAFTDMAMDVAFESDNILSSVQDMVEGILREISRLILAQTVGKALAGLVSSALGGGIPEAPGPVSVSAPNLNPTAGGVPGFQHGGSFKVPGSGGPDSKLVRFMATPGERVSVMPERGGGAGGGGGQNVQVFQETTFAPQMVDEEAGRRFLSRHRGDIMKMMAEAMQNDAVRQAILGGHGS